MEEFMSSRGLISCSPGPGVYNPSNNAFASVGKESRRYNDFLSQVPAQRLSCNNGSLCRLSRSALYRLSAGSLPALYRLSTGSLPARSRSL
jgi:hypothetical protein